MVSLSPGIHLRLLQRLLGSSFTTARYHVDNLVRDGEIVRWRDGRYDRLYPLDTSEEMKHAFACLQSKAARRVLQRLLVSDDDTSQGDLAKIVGLPRSTTSECTALLNGANLVYRVQSLDGHAFYKVTDRERAAELLATFKRGTFDLATEGFIDLWEL